MISSGNVHSYFTANTKPPTAPYEDEESIDYDENSTASNMLSCEQDWNDVKSFCQNLHEHLLCHLDFENE